MLQLLLLWLDLAGDSSVVLVLFPCSLNTDVEYLRLDGNGDRGHYTLATGLPFKRLCSILWTTSFPRRGGS